MRTSVGNTAWVQIDAATTTDVLLSVDSGVIRLFIGNASAVGLTDGHLFHNGQALVIPTGVEVNAVGVDRTAVVVTTPFGV